MNFQRAKFKDLEQIPPIKIKQDFKQDFTGTAPSPFIGRVGYPRVNIGILSPQLSGDTSEYDSPLRWSQNNVPIGTIASLRYSLVNSRTSWNVKDQHGHGKFLNICQEVGMASKPVEVEVNLQERPVVNIHPEREIMPFGPQGEIRKARITSNSHVDARVERLVSDTDLNANEALLNLYQKGFEENFLTKLLSVGMIGVQQNRKLVPTRWSITAVDDTLGKQLTAEIKNFPVGEYQLYYGGGWGNYYLILLFPEIWSYELFESYLDYKVNPWSKAGHFYSTDYENYTGRKEYAEETAGGYYACRLGVLEKLKQLKRQSCALSLRFITPEYNVPLGVWVCREATRKALAEKPLMFASEELMLQYAKEFIGRKWGFELDLLLKESKLLKEKKAQKRLVEF